LRQEEGKKNEAGPCEKCRECKTEIPERDACGDPVYPRNLCPGCFKALYPGYGVSKDNLPRGIFCPWCGEKTLDGNVDESGNFFYPYCVKCDLTTMVHINPKEDKVSREEYQVLFAEE